MGPGLVETLVPDRGGEADEVRETVLGRGLLQLFHHQLEELLSFIQLDEVHLVQQNKNLGVRRVLLELLERLGEDFDVFDDLLGFHIKHVYQHLNHLEDVVLLLCEIVLHKHILTTAIPEVKCHIPQEPPVRMLDVYGGTQAARVEGGVVAKDDGSHGGLSRAGTAHEEQFLSVIGGHGMLAGFNATSLFCCCVCLRVCVAFAYLCLILLLWLSWVALF